MADQRYKQTIQTSKENANLSRENTSKERDNRVDSVQGICYNSRLEKKETKFNELEELINENTVDAVLTLKADEMLERKKLSEEYAAIVKKQLQILQADERGKRALHSEIAEINRQQAKRSEALRARKKALETEKNRSMRIVSRPPPLPQSVKLMLKEHERKEAEAAALAYEVLKQEAEDRSKERDENSSENKENVEEISEEEKKLQEERDIKAKQRFNEALQKDRQKKEHAEVLKQIENAEKSSRREMAKNVSERGSKVPCTLPDRLTFLGKQAAMEDAVENVCKKSNSKEHAIEDLEGYEDLWETKYKKINSSMEERLIDCVPSFVKENYVYLLKEETSLRCGNRFSTLDDSKDDLNVAYIESPNENVQEVFNSSDEIDAAIRHLDKLRTESTEAFEKEFMPLLEAEAASKVSFDKAVEANILKVPTEHKAVSIGEVLLGEQLSSTSRSVQVDMSSCVTSYLRNGIGSRYKTHTDGVHRYYLPRLGTLASDSTDRDPGETNGGFESWSSSSYLSLPSKHGQPNICKLCDSPACNVPLAEDEKAHKDCIPLSKSQNKPVSSLESKQSIDAIANDSPVRPTHAVSNSTNAHFFTFPKIELSSYVQIVADKYLKNKSSTSNFLSNTGQFHSGTHANDRSTVQKESTIVFEKDQLVRPDEVSDQSSKSATISVSDSLVAFQKSRSPAEVSEQDKTGSVHGAQSDSVIDTKVLAFSKTVLGPSDELSETVVKTPEFPFEKSTTDRLDEFSDDKFIQRCHEIISSNLADVFSSNSMASTKVHSVTKSDEKQHAETTPTRHIYHELSTIQEMDSALTNDSVKSNRRSSLDENNSISVKSDEDKKNDDSVNVDISSASLVDAPVSEASKFAELIRFVPRDAMQPHPSNPQTAEFIVSVTVDSIGTLSSSRITDVLSSPATMEGHTSSSYTPLAIKHAETSSGSYGLLTPSSQSTLHSPNVLQRTPYSSSFQDIHGKHPHLLSVASLPNHFKDVSSIRQDNSSSSQNTNSPQLPRTPINYLGESSKAVSVQGIHHQYSLQPEDFQRQLETETSFSSFKPMTPHSYLATSSEAHPNSKVLVHKDAQKYNKSESQPLDQLSPQSHSGEQYASASSNSFQPMTPQSCFTTLSDMSSKCEVIGGTRNHSKDGEAKQNLQNTSDSNLVLRANEENFSTTTPHPYLSSPTCTYQNIESSVSVGENKQMGNQSSLWSQTVQSQVKSVENSLGSFQPMTPQSYLSNQSNMSSKYQLNALNEVDQRKMPGLFKDPKSSSPATVSSQDGSTRLNSFQPLSSHTYLSSISSSTSSNYLSPHIARRKGKKLSAQLRLQILNTARSSPNTLNTTLRNKNCEKQIISSFVPCNFSDNPLTITDGVKVKTPLKTSHNSQNYGLGHVDSQSQIDKNISNSESGGLIEGSLTKSDFSIPTQKFIGSSYNGCGDPSLEFPSKSCTSHGVPSESAATLSKQVSDVRESCLQYVHSPNPILEALKLQSTGETARLHSPWNSPSSSAESLPQMFTGSMITQQSTPVKTLEEIMQETGILDEPDLTLINTQFTLKPESPEKLRCEKSYNLTTLSAVQTLSVVLSTPSTSTTSQHCESPSMISFLQHEMSCLVDSTSEALGNPKPENIAIQKGFNQGYKSAGKLHSRGKSPASEYKRRTKRLWSNLEEVQNRKKLEQKQEQLTKNRLKMMAFSKKISKPKRDT